MSEEAGPTAAFGPDIVFDPGDETAGTREFWALVSATDGSGIAIDSVEAGDELRIIDASGICSFSRGKAKLVRSIVTVAANVAADAAGIGLWKTATDSVRTELDKHGDDDAAAKRRDAFGQEIGGGGDVAKEEGGLIVCLPPATGMVYSNGKVRRGDSKKQPPAGAFFLERGNERPTTIPRAGVIRIGVFDSNFKDNAGCYEIKFSLTRRNAGDSEGA